MNPNLVNKLLKIRQGDAVWQCTVRRAHLWITPKKQPAYRPFILLVAEQASGMILKTEIVDNRPAPQALLEHLFKTMQGSSLSFGLQSKQRPARICIDDAELAQACAPQLAEVGIRCEFRAALPQVEEALQEMDAHMNEREPMPGLLRIRGVSVPLVAELYAAAAEFYRQAPWRWLLNSEPVEVRLPADGPARYALVLGSGGEFFGLSLYESLADLEVLFSREDPDQPPPITYTSLILEEATLMSFEDLDAIERYNWPVAGEKAYPLALKTMPNGDFTHTPTADDIIWLAAALRTIPVFVDQYLHSSGQAQPRPAQASFPLPGIYGNQTIALRYPVSIPSSEQDSDPMLEAYIADWHWDEKSHEFARRMGIFLFEFLDFLDEGTLSRQTMQKHATNCQLIGWLVSRYGHHDSFTPSIFIGGPLFIDEFKSKVTDSTYALNAYKATWRKLEKYIISRYS